MQTQPVEEKKITFSFGENWKNYLTSVNDINIQDAVSDIRFWLGEEYVSGKTVIDVGSGSGIHSLAFYLLGAKEVISFDYDPKSVEATKAVRKKYQDPPNWKVLSGSVLDTEFIKSLPPADIVYSWGVLHHTGKMWDAIGNAVKLVKDNGKLWISIYQKGPKYQKHLNLKKRYNGASAIVKKMMILRFILKLMIFRAKKGLNPFKWNAMTKRGMRPYYDIIDWLGGLPYEVADKTEIEKFLNPFKFNMIKCQERNEGACSIYLLDRT